MVAYHDVQSVAVPSPFRSSTSGKSAKSRRHLSPTSQEDKPTLTSAHFVSRHFHLTFLPYLYFPSDKDFIYNAAILIAVLEK